MEERNTETKEDHHHMYGLNMLTTAFSAHGFEIYPVGGCVRDILMFGTPKGDIDLTTNATPDQTKQVLADAGLPVLPLGEAFGMIATVLDDLGQVEITTFRADTYRENDRHPVVTYSKTLEDDLKRRDFTINAIALADDGYVDPFGGRDDIRRKLLRTPQDAEQTMRDDPLRILRAFRFRSRFGFAFDNSLMRAIVETAPALTHISFERILMEMDKILVGEHVTTVLQDMVDLGVLQIVLPEMVAVLCLTGVSQGKYHSKDIWKHTLGVIRQTPADPDLRWAALLHDIGKPNTRTEADGDVHFFGHEHVGAQIAQNILKRLRFSTARRQRITFLVTNHMRLAMYQTGWKKSAVRRVVTFAGEYLDDLIALSRADITSARPDKVAWRLDQLQQFADRAKAVMTETPPERLIGKETMKELIDLMQLSGHEIGKMKTALEDAITDGSLPKDPSVDDALMYLSQAKA